MNGTELLEPDFLVIECTSTWGAYSYILTSCTEKQTVEDACESASEALEENEGQSIDFSVQTLQQMITDSCVLDEIKDGDRDGFGDIDHGLLTVEKIFLPENAELLDKIVDALFETGYDNGIIADYVECADVPVLKAS